MNQQPTLLKPIQSTNSKPIVILIIGLLLLGFIGILVIYFTRSKKSPPPSPVIPNPPIQPEPTEPEPEPKSSEPDIKPTEPEIKPSEPEPKPTEPEITPTEPEIKPTEPEIKPSEPEIKPNEPVIKSFNCGYNYSTPALSLNENDTIQMLDGFDVNCENNDGMNTFSLSPDGNQFKYNYQCCKGDFGNERDAYTSIHPIRNGNISNLGQFNIACEQDEAINQFKAKRLNIATFKGLSYNYQCVKSNDPLTCRQVTSIPKENPQSIYDLTQLQVNCEPGEVINQFKINNLPDNKIAYQYNCCKPKN